MATVYNEVLAAYDVEDNRSRTRLHKELKGIGLTPIQKSVFWGHLTPAEEEATFRLFWEHLKSPEDRAFVIRAKISRQIDRRGHGYLPGELYDTPKRYDIL